MTAEGSRMNILVINPGSTSTKLALFDNDTELYKADISISREESSKAIRDQSGARFEAVMSVLKAAGIRVSDLSAVVGRGGLLPPVRPGGYTVNKAMLDELCSERIMPHASNLGAILAHKIASSVGIPAYIYDPVTACSLSDIAKITGFKGYYRYGKAHVLNSRAVARRCAEKHGRTLESMRFIVAHLGGGISISALSNGEVVDTSSDDDGAFAPERSGGIPLLDVVEMCYSGKYGKSEMMRKIRGEGGLKALLGTTDCVEIENRIRGGDTDAKLVYDAQAYQIAKGIGIMSIALKCDIDAVILTGGIAHSKMLTDNVTAYVEKIAPVEVWPGEFEMEALALGAARILRNEEAAQLYEPAPESPGDR